jgi:hypothetical protein
LEWPVRKASEYRLTAARRTALSSGGGVADGEVDVVDVVVVVGVVVLLGGLAAELSLSPAQPVTMTSTSVGSATAALGRLAIAEKVVVVIAHRNQQ